MGMTMEDESSGSDSIDRNYEHKSSHYGRVREKDRLSALQDSILIHILSFLSTKDAIKTSLLSKRYRSLWTKTPTLEFHLNTMANADNHEEEEPHEEEEEEPDDENDNDDSSGEENNKTDDDHLLADFIDRTLILYRGEKIKKFSISLHCKEDLANRINIWIRFTAVKEVEDLQLDLLSGDFDTVSYPLPWHLCNFTWLRKLSLRCCSFHDKHVLFRWESLRVLKLEFVKLNDVLLANILSGSRLLEVLELVDCSGYNCLNIKSMNLKRLVIDGGDGEFSSSFRTALNIWCAPVKELAIMGKLHRKCCLMNVESVVKVKLDFKMLNHARRQRDSDLYPEYLNNLLELLKHVQERTVGSWCLQALTTQELRRKSLPMLKFDSLVLNTSLDKWELPGIRRLLWSSSQSDTLCINMKSPTFQFNFGTKFVKKYNFVDKNYWNLKMTGLPCLVAHLKTIRIENFTGDCNELEVVQFMLSKALVLVKKVVSAEQLKIDANPDLDKLLDLAQEMLSFSRTSLKAELLFSWQ